jgi:heterodisulfide reductase subunit A
MEKPVLVIGGGIAGIQVSLDLADRGLKVHIVEKSPSIGGIMAQLDKTFPTLDCSICILAPKMIEVSRHPNIKIHTLSHIKNVEGKEGDFTATVHKAPRSVDESKCTGCGICTEKCPSKVADEWQEGLTDSKAISIIFPQAVPLIANIDRDNCLYFQKNICQVCSNVCPSGAVDYEQNETEIELDVSSIIVATGFQSYDPSTIGEYGYGRYDDVITALEFERLISASGPTNGHLNRPSDGKKAQRIAFIQCVGSRSHNKGYQFCSSVCCMYATKEAILIKEHDENIDVTIFYLDLKVFGQGFQEFVDRAKFSINYIRGRPGDIRRHPISGDLILWYEDTISRTIKEMKVDLVVLCTTMIARAENIELAKILGIELDDYGFFKSKNPIINPIDTIKPGIFVCGCCHGPRDIPTSIAEASGTAAQAAVISRRFRQ